MVDRTILIVDQDQSSRVYIASALKQKQFHILEEDSGKTALISAWRDAPDIIIFDPAFPDLDTLEFVQKLRKNPRTINTPLIAISSDANISHRETCLNAGVNFYIFKSTETLTELNDVLDGLVSTDVSAKAPSKSASKKEKGQLFVFLSAKGGTGTSSLCANVGMVIQEQNPDAHVVVVDLVLPIGSIAQIVGYQGDQNLVAVADLRSDETNGDFFHQNLPSPVMWKFQFLAGSPDPEQGNNLNVQRIGEIVNTLRTSYDFVILDIGRSLSRFSLPLIQQADLIALIVSTDLSTVELTRTVWEYLHQKEEIDAEKIYAILNRAVGLEGLTKAEAEKLIGFPIKMAFPYMGGNFALANNLHQPILTKYPQDTASIIFKDVAGGMTQIARQLRGQYS